MTAVIVDDQAQARELLATLLSKQHPHIDILGQADNVADGEKLVRQTQPELVFLDVEMPGATGFELLKLTPDIDFAVVFITAHHEYAVHAFEVSAIDYLLKPLSATALAQAVEKVQKHTDRLKYEKQLSALQENIQSKFIKRLALPTTDGLLFVEAEDIIYLRAEGSYTQIIFSDREPLLVTRKIKYFDEHLSHPCFFRTHRSFLINLNKVRQYLRSESSIVMENKAVVALARDKKEQFLKRYGLS
jgi:two-component system LytT family response regulator